jgi:hypothetical protein
MKPAEIFTACYRAMKKQGERSIEFANGKCMYRGPRGLKCPIGHLISDKAGRAWDLSESSTIRGRVQSRSKFVEPWMREHLDLLTEIQEAHDKSTIEGFFKEMAQIGHRHGWRVPHV